MTESVIWQRPEDETTQKPQDIEGLPDDNPKHALSPESVAAAISPTEENLMLLYMKPSLRKIYNALQKLRTSVDDRQEKNTLINTIDREKFAIVQIIDMSAGTLPLSQNLLGNMAALLLFDREYDLLNKQEAEHVAGILSADDIDTNVPRAKETDSKLKKIKNSMQMRRKMLDRTPSDMYVKKLVIEFLASERNRQHPRTDISYPTLSQVHNRTADLLSEDEPQIKRIKFMAGNARNSVFRVMTANKGVIVAKTSNRKERTLMNEAQMQMMAGAILPDTPRVLSSFGSTFLMEAVRGTHKTDILSAPDAVKFCLVLMKKIHALHKKGIIHADIKPTNIISGKDRNPRVIDFGHAIKIQKPHGTYMNPEGLGAGTPPYMPLESFTAINNEKYVEVSEKIDVYAVGCMLFEMIVKEPLIPAPSEESAIEGMSNGYSRFLYYKTKLNELAGNQDLFTSSLARIDSPAVRKTLQGFLNPVSSKRYTSAQAVHALEKLSRTLHPQGWKKRIGDFLKKGRVNTGE